MQDKKADLIINGKVDDIICLVMKSLGLEIPEYENTLDPTRNPDIELTELDWTIPPGRVKEMKILYKKVCTPVKRKRKPFLYERHDIPEFPKKERKRSKTESAGPKTSVAPSTESWLQEAFQTTPKTENIESQTFKCEPKSEMDAADTLLTDENIASALDFDSSSVI